MAPILVEPLSSLDEFLERFSDDAEDRQLEVADGQPIVTPAPSGPHQVCVAALARLLHNACPAGYVVVPAPWDWVLWERPHLQLRQPDLVVASAEQAEQARLVAPPLLAVEILSPSSFERDAVTKRDEYARAGLMHYWLVDPTTPSVVVCRRQEQALAVVRRATGTEPIDLDEPFHVTFRPVDVRH